MTTPSEEYYRELRSLWFSSQHNRHYFVSPSGEVYCLRRVEGTVSKTRGYWIVPICGVFKKRIYKTIHSLIALAFNSVQNLEYVTQQENVIHAWKNGLSKRMSAEQYRKNGPKKIPSMRRLSDEQAITLINEYRNGGITMQALADKYSIPKTTACNVINGKLCYKEIQR